MSNYQPNQIPSSPYQSTGYQQPGNQRPAQSGSGRIILIILSLFGFLGLLSCGCCGALVYWGLQIDADQVLEAVKDDPNVQDQLGGIEKISMNWTKSASKDDTVYVYDVEGPDGKGTLYVRNDESLDEIIGAKLETENGEWELEVQQSDLEW